MSSLRGEQALKDGLSFEFTWTARHLIEILEERALTIQLGGQPGESGVDFRIGFPDHEEHHQVKRAFGTSGEWKLSNLEAVLLDFRDRLVDPRVHCHFVSTIGAVQLGYLGDRARQSDDFESYRKSYLNGDYSRWFSDLVIRWSLPPDECWMRLRRVFTHVVGEVEIKTSSLSILRSSVDGNPQDVWVHLRDYCFSHLNQVRRASDLWLWLEGKNYRRQASLGSPLIAESLAAQTKRYLEGIRQQLIKPQFKRQISATITGKLADAKEGMDLVILGAPGGGKSGVMLEVTDSCAEMGWPILAFRLDELSADITAPQLRAALNLPVTPAQAISLAAAGGPALVVIDQLDAVSHYSGRTSVLFDRVVELVQEIRGHRLRSPIHILIACRDIDWKHDGRFRQLHRPRFGPGVEDSAIHKIEELSNEEISSILKNCGLNAAAFSPRQYNELLRRPQYLALFIEAKVSDEEIPNIITPKQLFDAYWRNKERKMAQDFPSASTNYWSGILRLITQKLSDTASKLVPPRGRRVKSSNEAPLAVATSVLDGFPRTAVNWMISNGVIAESGDRIRFGHESLFDYCFARFFEERNQSLLEYLSESDQTLLQRGQLRQVMAYLRDDDIDVYVSNAKGLLDSDDIRPHLKLLLAVVLCSVPEPSDDEWKLICPYVERALRDIDGGNSKTLACQVFYAFNGSLALFERSIEGGVFSKWLIESGDLAINHLFRAILNHQRSAQQKVWGVVAPLLGDERFDSVIEWVSQFFRASESRETFEWMLALMKNTFAEASKKTNRREHFYSLCDDLEKNQPAWLAEWIAALIDINSVSKEGGGVELIRDHDVNANDVQSVAEKCPKDFIDKILPAVIRACERPSNQIWFSWRGISDEGDDSTYITTEESVLDSLVKSLALMLGEDPFFACEWLKRLGDVNSRICRRILAGVLCQDNSICVNEVVKFIADDPDNLSVIYGNHLAVCKMVSTYASRFSEEQLEEVEMAVLNYFPEWENVHSRQIGLGGRSTCAGTRRGFSQLNILRSFPLKYLSTSAVNRLSELERKFPFSREKPPKRQIKEGEDLGIFDFWSPQRYLEAITAQVSRGGVKWWLNGRRELNVEDLLRRKIKDRPSVFVEDLESRKEPVFDQYLKIVAEGLLVSELPSSLAVRAAAALRTCGYQMSHEYLYLLKKVPGGGLPEFFLNDIIICLNEGPGPNLACLTDSGKRGEQLHGAAINSMRGQAIEVLARWIWDDSAVIPKIATNAVNWMTDSNPAIRAEMALLCYAIAFYEEYSELARNLFKILSSDSLPEDEILASRWPWKFMQAGLREEWDFFAPIVEQMTQSKVSEVRASGARLVCMGLIVGCDCLELANACVASDDSNVRLACADVVSKNLGHSERVEWQKATFMTLANDSNNNVCRSIGHGFYGHQATVFSGIGELLADYIETRAFLLSPGRLILGLEESANLLPDESLAIVKNFIRRLNDPNEDSEDRIIYHINSIGTLLKRLYHENRDGVMRREALDLIDELSVMGSLAADSLDQ